MDTYKIIHSQPKSEDLLNDKILLINKVAGYLSGINSFSEVLEPIGRILKGINAHITMLECKPLKSTKTKNDILVSLSKYIIDKGHYNLTNLLINLITYNQKK